VEYYIIVDPNETMAKVYNLNNGRYIKICDAYDEVVDFDLEKCTIKFDFSRIW